MSIENVNHPSHYNVSGRKECIVEMEEKYSADWVAVFCLLNAYKYDYRAGEKEGNPEKQDNSKSEWYKEYAKSLVRADKIKNHDVLMAIIKENHNDNG